MSNILSHVTLDSLLGGVQFPIDHDDLVHLAQINHASPELLEALGQLPLGEFDSEQEVIAALEEQGYSIS